MNWFNGGGMRSFKSSPPPEAKQAEASKAQNAPTAAESVDSAKQLPVRTSHDPKAKEVEAAVSEEVARMKQAYEEAQKSPKVASVPTSEKAVVRVSDSDSLAAKISQPKESPYASQPFPAPTPKIEKKAESERSDRPVISQIRSEPKSGQLAVTKTEVKDAVHLEPATITQIEPVRTAKSGPIEVKGESALGKAQGGTPQAANTSIKIDIPDPEDPNSAMDVLANRLKRRLKDRPSDTSAQLQLRLLYGLRGQWEEALKSGKEIDGGELARNLAALVKVFDSPEMNSAQQANEAIKLLESIEWSLRRQADLQISNIQLCREVTSFGCYKPMPSSYFVAGKSLPVIVYLELDNFTSKYLKERDAYQTQLSLTTEVLDGSGVVVWRQHDEQIEDTTNKRRRDFYIARLVTFPPGLPAGKLKLKVTVEDLHGNKSVQRLYPFELRAEP